MSSYDILSRFHEIFTESPDEKLHENEMVVLKKFVKFSIAVYRTDVPAATLHAASDVRRSSSQSGRQLPGRRERHNSAVTQARSQGGVGPVGRPPPKFGQVHFLRSTFLSVTILNYFVTSKRIQ